MLTPPLAAKLSRGGKSIAQTVGRGWCGCQPRCAGGAPSLWWVVSSGGRRLKLRLVQLLVPTPRAQQLHMPTGLDDLPVLHDEDRVRCPDRREAMGDHHGSTSGQCLGDRK